MEAALLVLAGLLVGAVAALKIFAPKTKNKVDDAILERLEWLEDLVKGLLPKPAEEQESPAPESKPAVKPKVGVTVGSKAKK